MQNQNMTEQIETATMEGTRKRETPRKKKRWAEEAEEDLNIKRIQSRQAMTVDRRKLSKTV
jgi:hypothetical protein